MVALCDAHLNGRFTARAMRLRIGPNAIVPWRISEPGGCRLATHTTAVAPSHQRGHIAAGMSPSQTKSATSATPPANVRSNTRTAALMDISAVAARLGVTERFIRRLVFERRIPYLKVGRLLRFDPEAVEAWLDDARQDIATIDVRSRSR